MGERLKKLAEDLEFHSDQLLQAVLQQDPSYLEHLENRQQTLEMIRQVLKEEHDAAALYHLHEALRLGALADTEVRTVRAQTWVQFNSLRQQQQFASALQTQTEIVRSALDVKA